MSLAGDGAPVLVFDGDCGFCTSAARWIEQDLSDAVTVVPWQHLNQDDFGHLGITEGDAREAVWWIDPRGRFRGHRAIGMALRAAPWPKRWIGTAILVPPGSWVAAAVYPAVVRHRHRLPGGTPACRVPTDSDEVRAKDPRR